MLNTGALYSRTAMVALVVAAAGSAPSAAYADTRDFHLSAQPAASGVTAFARQAGSQVFISASDASNRRTNAVDGAYPVGQAMAMLLQGSGLIARPAGTGTYAVVAQAAPMAASRTAWQQPAGAPEQQPDQSAAARVRLAENGALDPSEILVTARKRAESLENVPAAVTVISGLKLEKENLNNYDQLQTFTSGLVIRRNANNQATISIRGLGGGTVIDSFDQSVASFFDGTYVGRGPEFNAAIFDVSSVQLLKGGQASLLSKNTSLGAIVLTTRTPGKDFGFDLTGTQEFRFGSTSLQGGVDIPLSDTVQVRLAGQFQDEQGWIYNRARDTHDPVTRTAAGRITVHWTPVDTFDATLMYQHYDVRQNGFSDRIVNDPLGNLAHLSALNGDTNFRVGQQNSNSAIFGDSKDNTHGDRAILTANYKMGSYTLTSVSSYSDFDEKRLFDSDYIVGDYLNAAPHPSNTQQTQEFRIASPTGEDHPFDFVAGAFLYHEKWIYRRSIDAICQPCDAAAHAAYVLTGAFNESDHQNTTTVSLFQQSNLRVTNHITAGLGLRYTHEKRSATLQRDVVTPGPLINVLYNAIPRTTLRRKEDDIDGVATLQYKFNPDLVVYASASKGTKGGGFQNAPTTASGAAYKQEKAYSEEIGLKIKLPRNGYFNIDVYNTYVKDFQQSLYTGVAFLFAPRNIRSQGVEADAAIPLSDYLRLEGSVTYQNTRRKDHTAGYNTHPFGAPLWSGNVNLNYNRPIDDKYSLDASAGIEFRSLSYLTDEELTLGDKHASATAVVPPSAAYGKINARLGIQHRDGWEIALIGLNLNNVNTLTYGFPVSLIGRGAIGFYAKPRTVALQFSIHR
jgi:iron complex outermembrane receptor protein